MEEDQRREIEEIVTALREIAAGRFTVEGRESRDPEEKRRLEMTKSERGKGHNQENTHHRKKDDREEISTKEDGQEAGITRRICKDHRDKERIS